MANSTENLSYEFPKELQGLFVDRMGQNEEITARYLGDNEFRDTVDQNLLQDTYQQIHDPEKGRVKSEITRAT